MSLRKKTLIPISFLLILFIIAVYLLVAKTLVSKFDSYERDSVRTNVERVKNALAFEVQAMDTFVNDWAARDDTYSFIVSKDAAYIQSNLVDSTFTDAKINFALFVNRSGSLVFGKAFDYERRVAETIPDDLLSHVKSGDILISHRKTTDVVKGIMLLKKAPALLVSRPIITSKEEGPIRGALIMGRYLDEDAIARIGQMTQLDIALKRCDEEKMGADFSSAVKLCAKGGFALIPRGDKIYGYSIIRDIYGKNALIMRVTRPRTIHLEGVNFSRNLAIAVFVMVVCVLGLTFLLMDRLVITPIARLGQKMREIEKSGNLSSRVDIRGEDEVSKLGMDINRTLVALECSDAERHKREDEIRRINRELEGYAHAVSHELKGPLSAAIAGSLTLDSILEKEGTPDLSLVRELSEIVKRNLGKCEALVNDLLSLALAAQAPEDVKEVDVSEIVKRVLEEWSNEIIEKGISVNVERDLGKVRANETHVYQMFSNLISNAIKYNDSPDPVITLSYLGSDEQGRNRYLVKDNGSGIPDDLIHELFEPFTKGSSGNTGIGLAIAKKIVDVYGGKIRAYNDGGACFEFSIGIPES